jgi:hypothetical protein
MTLPLTVLVGIGSNTTSAFSRTSLAANTIGVASLARDVPGKYTGA